VLVGSSDQRTVIILVINDDADRRGKQHSSILENFEMRHSHRQKHQGFTLVELLVVIAIIGTLVGLLLPAVQAAREAARSNTCRNNLTQLQKAITQRETRLGEYPGYMNTLGIKGTLRQTRASWVVTTFPDIEQAALWDRWNQDSVVSGSTIDTTALPQLEILLCPSDPATMAGAPLLSYVANSGWIQQTNGTVTTPLANSPWQERFENPANGVFLDKTRAQTIPNIQNPNPAGSHIGPDDYMDDNNIPMQNVNTAYIQSKGDGTTQTMLLSENRRATTWTYPNGGDYSTSGTPDEKYHFGYCWEQPEVIANGLGNNTDPDSKGYFRMNAPLPPNLTDASLDYNNYQGPADMRPVDGFANSNHPGGVNVAFVGGAVQYVGDSIEPRVYAQLMTSNRNQSDLNVAGTFEKNLPPLSEGEY
jgi:prepilin-type N-terminal cleavage/methylation domain-containing protein/prepilin-type processing-associated H-X9-DG protein